ncbi:MAG: ATP synthase F1 subunit delta [Coriobacteriales bacterium]|jgi:F-type H+-transporting ATPase subunit delta
MPKNRMLIKQEINTYTDVLLDFAKEKGNEYEISAQLEEMKKVVRMSPGLDQVLNDDTLPEDTRADVIGEVFKEFDPDLVKFLLVMGERGDISHLGRIAELYDQKLQERDNVVILDVSTVIELDDELREKIKSKFAAQFDKEIVLREHVEPWILGGINVRANGKRIDCCTATRLDKVRVALSSVTTGGER